QTFAANLRDDSGMAVLDLGEPLAEHDRAPTNPVEKARRQDDIEHGVTSRHCQRIGTKGRTMGAGRHPLAGFCGGEGCPQRESAADGLGDAHHIGSNAAALVGEEATSSPDARLDFVEDEQEAMLIAEFTQATQKWRRRHPYAAFALDRLDQNCSGLWRD